MSVLVPVWVLVGWRRGSRIQDDNRAAAILAARDVALEVEIGDRVVLGLHRQPLLAGHQAGAAGDRPALQHAVELEPQVVVETARRMLLDDEPRALAASALRLRLGGAREIALLLILREGILGGSRALRLGRPGHR